jgi:hypothetical protein
MSLLWLLADEVIEETRGLQRSMNSALGTFATCRLRRAMSVLKGIPEDICSGRVLLILTVADLGEARVCASAIALGKII